MSPIQSFCWGALGTTSGDFPNVFDYWSLPRNTLSFYRLSAICQPKHPHRISSYTPRQTSCARIRTVDHSVRNASEFLPFRGVADEQKGLRIFPSPQI